MNPRKTVQDLRRSGTWNHLSKGEQARRLAEEQPLIPGPDRTPCPAAAPPVPPPASTLDAGTAAKAYVRDVLSGEILAGKFVRLACQRFLGDLENAPTRGLTFDAGAAQHVVAYISNLGLKLLPWQLFVLANLFGWKNRDGLRRYRNAYVQIAKKNGKTSLSAALALYMADTTRGDGEPKANVFVAATTKYQSQSLCFKMACQLRNETPDLVARTRIWKSKSSIVFEDAVDSTFEPLAANSDKLNGLNMHGGILDELGDHTTSKLYEVFLSSTPSRRQPLTLSITTAGAQRDGQIAWEVRNRAAQVLEGTAPDDTFFAYVAELDEGDRWEDEAVWIKANPSLYTPVLPIDGIRTLLQSARAIPATRQSFQRFNLNIWPTTSDTGWINFDDLTKQGNAYISHEEKRMATNKLIEAALERHVTKHRNLSQLSMSELLELQRRQVSERPICGLDVAIKEDLSVLCMLYPPKKENGIFEVFFRIWCPEENIGRRTREQRVPYELWRDEGFLIATPGSTTDFDWIENDILALNEKYNFAEVGFDRAVIPDLAQRLEKARVRMTMVTQGYNLSAAIQHVQKQVMAHKFCGWGNPIWRWCASNTSLRVGFKGDVQMIKERSREKIDAAAAAVIAMHIFLNRPQQAKPTTAAADRYRVLYIDQNRAEMPFKTASAPVVADPNCVLVTLKATGEIKSLPKQNAAYLIQRGLALEVK